VGSHGSLAKFSTFKTTLSASVIARKGIYDRRGNPPYGTFNLFKTISRSPVILGQAKLEPRIQENGINISIHS
jgi:hypothetical protein